MSKKILLEDIKIDDGYFGYNSKSTSNRNRDKWGFLKSKRSCKSKEAINKVKMRSTNIRKYLPTIHPIKDSEHTRNSQISNKPVSK